MASLPAGLHLWGTFSARTKGSQTDIGQDELLPQLIAAAPARDKVADVALGFNAALVRTGKGRVGRRAREGEREREGRK